MRMIHTAGFDDVVEHDRFAMRFRGQRRAVPHVVMHAKAAMG